MDFGLTDMQRLYRDQIREFVQESIIGENLDWDADENFPTTVYESLAELGVTSMLLPDEAGGSDLGPLTAGLVFEELGRGDAGLAMLVLAETLVNKLLYDHGTEEHRAIAEANGRGEVHLAFGLTEPEQGSDAQSLETTATPAGEGWVINGSKTAITGGVLADYCLVFARNEESEIKAFLVPCDADGVDVQRYEGMGCTVSGWSQLFFDDVRVGAGGRVSAKNGFKLAMEAFDVSRAWIGLYSLGAAQQTIDETIDYLKEREAFGQPLAAFEGPQFEIAEIQTRVECARLKGYETLWKAEVNEPSTRDAAMIKWLGPAVSVEAIRTCLVLHGHYGYSKDFGIEKRLRDVQGQQIADGTPQVQKIVIGRETFGREYLPY